MSEGIADDDLSEIEITPEMIEAGLYVFSGMDTRFELEEDVVADIFVAMTKAKTKATGAGMEDQNQERKRRPLRMS